MIKESYNGRNELISYLKESKKKSFRGFLLQHRKEIVSSSIGSLVMSWKDFDNIWYDHFMREAEVTLDRNDFVTLKDKVRFYFTKKHNSPCLIYMRIIKYYFSLLQNKKLRTLTFCYNRSSLNAHVIKNFWNITGGM
jgi:hypothetical protein